MQRNNNDRGGQKKKKKEMIVDLSGYMDQKVRVKFSGGREVAGVLRGWDPLINIVLDECVESLRGRIASLVLLVALPPGLCCSHPTAKRFWERSCFLCRPALAGQVASYFLID